MRVALLVLALNALPIPTTAAASGDPPNIFDSIVPCIDEHPASLAQASVLGPSNLEDWYGPFAPLEGTVQFNAEAHDGVAWVIYVRLPGSPDCHNLIGSTGGAEAALDGIRPGWQFYVRYAVWEEAWPVPIEPRPYAGVFMAA